MSCQSIMVVIPILNEVDSLHPLLSRLTPVLNGLGVEWDICFVDDGSTDETVDLIRQFNASDERVKGISLSRNFGQDIALAAGLRYSRGDAAVLMDVDLQHPPEILEAFVAKWREGYQVVYGQRVDQATARTLLRRLASRLYYAVFRAVASTAIPDGAGDFCLLDRRAVDALNRMGEAARFSKGLYSWIGFRSTGVPYHVSERLTGTSKWRLWRLVRFAFDGLISFSTLPLRIWSLFGFVISLIAVGYAAIVLTETLVFGRDSPGYPTLIISIMLLAGVQLISLGILGEYLGRVYEEVKRRPLFIVAEEIGMQGRPSKLSSNIPMHVEP